MQKQRVKVKKRVDRSLWNEYEEACKAMEASGDVQEFAINWTKGSKTATVFFPVGRMNTKVRRLVEKYPDEATIVHENNDGSIVAHVPVSAIKISIIKKEMTDEQRQEMRERIVKAQQKKGKKK